MKIGIARIYYGGGRRWFTLRAACRAHAKSIIKTRWMSDGNGLEDEWPTERVERLANRLEREHRRNTP
jgi:hypothetical protein